MQSPNTTRAWLSVSMPAIRWRFRAPFRLFASRASLECPGLHREQTRPAGAQDTNVSMG